MNPKYKELIEQSKKFRKSFDNIIIGAESYENKKTTEENILHLQNLNKILDSKLKAADLELSNKNISNLNISKSKDKDQNTKLLEKLLDKKIFNNLFDVPLLSEKLLDLFKDSNNSTEINEFKENIMKLLKKMALTNDALIRISENQNKLLEEISRTRSELEMALKKHKERLMNHTWKTDAKSIEIEKQKMTCEKRIEKINFMRKITTELLILGEPSDRIEDSMEIFERCRNPITYDDLADPDFSYS